MKLIVGLGNPGNKYALTRHNIGFMVVDYIVNFLNKEIIAGKGDWYGIECTYNNEQFYLMKPSTYMNNSGLAVLNFIAAYNIDLNDVLIIYDDFQLSLGTIRVRMKGSDGGHNGISSVIYHLNTLDFPRMRIGIGGDEVIKKDEYVDYVLSNFTESEITNINDMMIHYKDCVMNFLSEGAFDTMNKFNKNFLYPEKDFSENNLLN
jgi:PTH1 family peptidyl-tRNA hydrolase